MIRAERSLLGKRMSEYEIVTDESGVRRAPVPPSLITVTRVVYALHALSILIGVFTGASIATAFVFGWPSIIAVIINYVERSDVRGTYLDSHFSWQIRTFWYALLWIILVWLLGLLLAIFLIGFAIWIVGFVILGIWVCYRIIRGWMRLSDGLPMPM
jgi:Predicted membrane protein